MHLVKLVSYLDPCIVKSLLKPNLKFNDAKKHLCTEPVDESGPDSVPNNSLLFLATVSLQK